MIRAEHFLGSATVRHSPQLIKNPVVSVILPTYFRAASGLLSRAIESVLSQSFASFELIVMDDGSTDGTADMLAEFVKRDDRVIHVRHDNNSGLPALRVNEGLMMARGRYCAYQFDDDTWTKDALSALVGELEGDSSYDVAYGKALAKLAGGGEICLGEPFNYSSLMEGNRIANNSLVHRRSVFERFGGYDMHLVMRRLCDWDLWLRWGRQVRFLFVDQIVSLVDADMEHSLAKTVHFDGLAARAHMALPRDALLTPDRLKDYPLDGLGHLAHLGRPKTDEIWRQLVAPFQSRHRKLWPCVRPPRDRPLHVLVVKAHFDTTVDITINNFREALAPEFAFTFVPQLQVTGAVLRTADILLLHRTIDQHAKDLLHLARHLGKCVIFLMDDDLLSLHELSGEFGYLAPGQPCREALEYLIGESDLTLTYSRLMQDSVAGLNPRNIRLETNIASKWLDRSRAKRSSPSPAGGPVKIAFAGGGARKEEFAALWPAIVAASHELAESAEFHFWGFTPDGIAELRSPCHCEGFTFSYEEYLKRLTESHFDVMIAPLFADKKAKRAKCPIKFLEITAAGAIGVYSDVEPYEAIVDGVTGLKCENSIEAWSKAILRAAKLGPAQRQRLLAAALSHIGREFTSEAQAPMVGATLEAALLHAALGAGGTPRKPRIAYFCHSPYLGGAENHLLRHALIASSFQFEAVLVLPSSARAVEDEMQARAFEAGIAVDYLPLTIETEIDASRRLDADAVHSIYAWLVSKHIAVAHSATLMREVGEACRKAGIAHVASLYATQSEGYAGVSHCDYVHSDSLLYANRWAEILGVPARRILSHVPDGYFDGGEPLQTDNKKPLAVGIFGTLQPRKGQLQAIEAIGLLARDHGVECTLNIYGYDHFFADYLAQCKQMAKQCGVESRIFFNGFVKNPASVLPSIDIVLCASDWESLPQVILEGMAAGKIIVTPLVGGVAEVISHDNGIVLPDNSATSICRGLLQAIESAGEDIHAKRDLARQVAAAECTKNVVAAALFALYREAAELACADKHPKRGFARPVGGGHAKDSDLSLRDTLDRLRLRLHGINAPAGRPD